MTDVVVMAYPVQKLSAAVSVIPAPTFVKVTDIEGQVFRRPNPEIVIHFLRWIGIRRFPAGAREVGMARRQADLDAFDLSDVAVKHQLRALAEVGHASLPGPGLPNPAVFLHRLH